MTEEIPFQIDTSGGNVSRSSRLFYSLNGDLDASVTGGDSKPSQERPAIMKMKAKRYHEKGDDSKFVPGKLSKELRGALGLGFKDIPEHIYRMRHLGYPPGWLKRAEVQSENMSITGANAVVHTSRSRSVKYDWAKLYPFPGFNTRESYDSHHDLGCKRGFMAMQDNSLLENFRTFLSRQHLLGKEPTDMKDIRSRNVIDSSTDFNLPPGSSGSVPMATSTPTRLARAPPIMADLSDGEVDDNEDDSAIQRGGASLPSNGDAKTENGTVLLVAPFSKPSLDRFSEGINDHRLFENLPNIGGTYQKVLGVLKRFQS